MIPQPAAATRPHALLGFLEGLADPTRLRLLRLLDREELGVVELCGILKLPQSTASRHLKVLSSQGWLENRRQGTASLYRLAPGLDPGARRLWRLAREETQGWAVVRQDDLRLEARLRARRQDARSFFAGAAGEWDRLRAELFGERFGREALLALLPAEWTVADLGCGTGAFAVALAPHVRRVVGIDQSAAMLRAARRRAEGLANVELHRAELEAIPLPDGAVDAALLVLVLGYVAERAPVLAEAARVLRPGGQLIVVDVARHDDEAFRRRMGQAMLGFEPSEVAALLAGAGLADRAVRPLAPDPGAKGPPLLLARSRKPQGAERAA